MAKDKPQPQDGPELAEYITTAEPKAYADGSTATRATATC